MKLTIKDIQNALNKPPENLSDEKILTGISTDSRTINHNDLFVAIKGENFNGNHFIDEALKNGASAVITEQHHQSKPVFVVDNSVKALGKIASYYSSKIKPITISVTGTNGKTTVTNLVAYMLKQSFRVLQT